ncbi:DUF975 family protein [Holzapfeliella floricola]|uniref:DUF975 family protein n=2 Tax=Holzapfeliella TaxID=2767883 RepID=A0A0R2DME3_9LACO|nr:DUF975 family protein [Holzapfeliella floricola]KRN04347.1 hypothetical protein FC86_GL000445 [Holzapfeliella floricola DSM 23037 = JCM 16512]
MDSHYYTIKARAKELLSHQQPYYVSLTALHNLAFIIIRFVSTIFVMMMCVQIIQMNTYYYYVGNSYTSSNVFMSMILLTLLGSPWLFFAGCLSKGIDIKFLEWYRTQKVTRNASGIKDSFALFSHNRFFPYTVLGFFVFLIKIIFIMLAGLIASWVTLFIALFNSLDSTYNLLAVFIGGLIFLLIKNTFMLFLSQVYYVYYDMMQVQKASFIKAVLISFRLIGKNFMHYMWLNLSFVGWNIVDFCCFGMLRLAWLDAYMRMTYAGFYDYMKERESVG